MNFEHVLHTVNLYDSKKNCGQCNTIYKENNLNEIFRKTTIGNKHMARIFL